MSARRDEAQALRANGLALREIAQRLGYTYQRAQQVCRGVRPAGFGREAGWTKFTAEQDAFIRAHYRQNLSAAEIARRMNRTKNSIIGRANRLGLSVQS